MSTPTPSATLLGMLPTTLRKTVYSLFGTAGVAVGGIEVAFAAAGHGQPTWLTVTTAVLVFLGIPVSATALLHVPAAVPQVVNQVAAQVGDALPGSAFAEKAAQVAAAVDQAATTPTTPPAQP